METPSKTEASADSVQLVPEPAKDGDPETATEVPYTVFTKTQQRLIMTLCGAAGFFSPFSVFTYFPALNQIADDLGVTIQLMNLTITMYLVVQGIVPAVLGDLADQVGRRPVYVGVLGVYLAANLGLAVQRSYPALLVLRMVQSAGSSGTVALGIMVVADLVPPHHRGRSVGAMLTGPNCASSIGPVVGGLLAHEAGWPWIFWCLAILGGACLVAYAALFPETCRHVVGNGSIPARGLNKTPFPFLAPDSSAMAASALEGVGEGMGRRRMRVPNPFLCLRLIARRHDFLILSSYAWFYMSYSCIHAALAPLVQDYYGLNELQSGLCYLSYGVAAVASSYLVGKVLDWDYQVTARKMGFAIQKVSGDDVATFPIERARIRSLWYAVVLSIASTVALGWVIETRTHLAVLNVLLFLSGTFFTGVFNAFLTLNVDLHPDETGLASVAASLVRCLAGAVGVAFLQPLMDRVGPAWTFTFIGLLGALSLPALLVLRLMGPGWRNCPVGKAESQASKGNNASVLV